MLALLKPLFRPPQHRHRELPESEIKLTHDAKQASPPDVFGLANKLNIQLIPVGMPDEMTGEIFPTSDGWVIRYNSHHPLSRQRFTIAHMIGHYVYHRDLLMKGERPGTNDNRRYRSDPKGERFSPHLLPHHETQANRYAIRLVMPETLVMKLMRQHVDQARVADELIVTPEALELRLKLLSPANSNTR